MRYSLVSRETGTAADPVPDLSAVALLLLLAAVLRPVFAAVALVLVHRSWPNAPVRDVAAALDVVLRALRARRRRTRKGDDPGGGPSQP